MFLSGSRRTKNRGEQGGASDSSLSVVFNALKTTNDDQRDTAADGFRIYVTQQVRDLSSENARKFLSEITSTIFSLVNSAQDVDRVAGIAAVDCLIDVDVDENASAKIKRLADHLGDIFTSNSTDVHTLSLAARSLGKLVRHGGTVSAEIFDREVRRGMDWLSKEDKHQSHRQASVFILRELATNAPPLFYVHVVHFFDIIWCGLKDVRTPIREGSAEALRAALELISERRSRQRNQWYDKIWQKALLGLKEGSTEAVHGSLLAIGELLKNAVEFMHNRYKEVSESVLKFKEYSKNDKGLVRRCVMSIMPILAEFDPVEFHASYITTCMTYLMDSVDKRQDVESAFIALGKIAKACRGHKEYVVPFANRLVSIVKGSLSNKKTFCVEAMSCISNVAVAVGNEIGGSLPPLLPLMLGNGLSKELTDSLAILAEFVPSQTLTIQGALLNMLSQVIAKQPWTKPLHPGEAQAKPARTSESTATRSSGQFQNVAQKLGTSMPNMQITEETIELALKTLGTFGFPKEPLLEFVRDHILNFVDDDSVEIRRTAALTCANLVRPSKSAASSNDESSAIVSEVIENLLLVGIADPDPSIRRAVLAALDERFDAHLAMAANLRSLFIALNDEIFGIRELVITIIGRLSIRNPAFVMPSLRKTLVQLLTELEFSGDSRNKAESAILLKNLISSSKQLMEPYVEGILKALLPKLRDPSPQVAISVLAALGDLSRVAGISMKPYLNVLLPFIIDCVQDQSSSHRRHVAVQALGQLVGSTGEVIRPFLDYPNLMNLLLGMLKSEQLPAIRHELLRTLGILGALDPYKHKTLQLALKRKEDSDQKKHEIASGLSTLSPSTEEYHTIVAVMALMRILSDPSLSVHHTPVIETTINILEQVGVKQVGSLVRHIMPPFLQVMRTCDNQFRSFLFEKLVLMVSLCEDQMSDYLNDVFEITKQFWSQYLLQIIPLVEAVSTIMSEHFKVYLPDLIPQLLTVLSSTTAETDDWAPASKVLHALEVFGKNLDDYLHLVVPAIIRLLEKEYAPARIRIAAIQTLGRLATLLDFSDYASRISHPLARVLSAGPAELQEPTMDALCVLMYELRADYSIIIPMINKVCADNGIYHPLYEDLVGRLLKFLPMELPQEFLTRVGISTAPERRNSVAAEQLRSSGGKRTAEPRKMNSERLLRAWATSQRTTKEDWIEWMRKFSVELLRESPSYALYACLQVAGVHHALATELFPTAFLSCWNVLDSQYRDHLVQSLKSALLSDEIPPEITQILLNQAEFMERDDQPLPIDYKTLGVLADKCHAYAKALHYKEIEFREAPNNSAIEALISINNHLQQPEAAVGILTHAQQQHDVELETTWYEKLQRWDQALDAYSKMESALGRSASPEQRLELSLGRMRCMHALGEWEQLATLSQSVWKAASDKQKGLLAPLAASATWNLGKWGEFEEYVERIRHDTVDGCFFRAVLNMHGERYEEAQEIVNKARQLLDGDLTALVGESYNRAYPDMVRVQQLSEIEEIIDYKLSGDFLPRREMILNQWKTRLSGCQHNVEVWQQVLVVRSLVKQDPEMWLKFAGLCRKSGHTQLARTVVINLLGKDPSKHRGKLPSSAPAPVQLAYLKQLWAEHSREDAIARLRTFCSEATPEEPQITARAYLLLGEWERQLTDVLDERSVPRILSSYRGAIQKDATWYKAWHAWALINFEALSFFEKGGQRPSRQIIAQHLIPSLDGFFRSIALSPGHSLQDTLRLLTLWFQHGDLPEVEKELHEGFSTVSIDTWLQVIPQIIARIHSPMPAVRRLIQQLLINIGKAHPQALVYPLVVASKSQSSQRQAPAQLILEDMKLHSPRLVEQAAMVSDELIRISIVWHEQWHEGLEEASRMYYNEQNVEGMIERLLPLHEMVENGPETLTELSFVGEFGRNLVEAREWTTKYQRTKESADLNQAWDLYYQVFKHINKLLPTMKTFELKYVSPNLLNASDLDLAVPGTYKAGQPIVSIGSFSGLLTVIASKQRPRKTSIFGSDGAEYGFLLKGHEDLRQDERVMQLFGLVNTLLAGDSETSKSHLSISRYSVIPLSPNSGLIGWVPHCDTLHASIAAYRAKKDIELKLEQRRLMQEGGQGYDNLPLINKVEIYEYAIGGTDAQDLNHMLWLKSRNSEVWLDRRTTYTRSLALMSMVGYILGLGDRHPSNLMQDRLSGKIVHIDFGDCFEVAMHRDKYPEKIPFRLTRMLINAMEAGGIEGNFRNTCENVMRVLRMNKESLMAVLEAFVHDPLINWRLLNTDNHPSSDDESAREDEGESGGLETLDSITPNRGQKQKGSQLDDMQLDQMSVKMPEVLNERAVTVIDRVSSKLTGTDFNPELKLDVADQVRMLIEQATSHENLCQCYMGWCPFW
eukprot:TRINITY_DN1189_c0_g1_i1.p1 TRINITY_DN1189_c0_g1~~TRINITY_DN1189_c0_g1_i1.p1  ORF type:complete len:2421 (+),score=972.86 TRINITY_DN1189_c0_g1_i1:126-7265(+)